MLRMVFISFILLFTLSCSKKGSDELRVGIPNGPRSLKSWELRDGASTIIGHQIHRGLFDYHPETGEIIPYAVKSWRYTSKFKAVEFTLRDDLSFHNGVTLKCEHVKNSFIRLVSQNKEIPRILPKSTGFKCIDNKFLMEMSHVPYKLFDVLSSPMASISLENGLIGIGPFKLLKQTADQINLEQVDKSKKLNFFINTEAKLVELFNKNKIDDLLYIGLFKDLKLKAKKVNAFTPTSFWMNINSLTWNFSELESRKHVQKYIKYWLIKNNIFSSENLLNGLVPFGVFGHNQFDYLKKDVEGLNILVLKKQLLALVKKHGKILISLRSVNENVYAWKIWIKQMDPNGELFNVEFLDNKTFFTKYYQKKLSVFFIGANVSRNDPFEVFSFFSSTDKVNPAGVKDNYIKRISVEYYKSSEVSALKKHVNKANAWIIKQGYIVPLFSKKFVGYVKNEIRGLKINPLGPLMIDYQYVYKD